MTVEEFFHSYLNGIGELDNICKDLMVNYAELKCKELLEILAEKADKAHIGGWKLDRDDILNTVDLKKFCHGSND